MGQFKDASAESRRSSSSDNNCVLLSAEALGPGEVRGRRTLLSQPRDARFFDEVLMGDVDAGGTGQCCVGVGGASTARPAVMLMAVSRSLPSSNYSLEA